MSMSKHHHSNGIALFYAERLCDLSVGQALCAQFQSGLVIPRQISHPMLQLMRAVRKYFQIFESVIRAVFVFVVNFFVRSKGTTYGEFHNVSMFVYDTPIRGRNIAIRGRGKFFSVAPWIKMGAACLGAAESKLSQLVAIFHVSCESLKRDSAPCAR